jgi:prepilin-type N-terminal cleavage/methylation domain-containing protein
VCRNNEQGFTLVETLVAIALFAVISVGFYQVLLSVVDSSELTRSVVDVSEEARLGFNRMVRDTREGQSLLSASSTAYEVQIDFNGNGVIEPTPSSVGGDYEVLDFRFDSFPNGKGVIRLNGEVLMRGVDCLGKVNGVGTCKHDVFSYESNRLEYDANGNGVTSVAELDQVSELGNNNGILDGAELAYITSVNIRMQVTEGEAKESFFAEAQLRNQR